MNVVEHIAQRVWIPIQLFGIDISITNEVAVLWVAVLATVLFFYFAGKNAKIIPNKLQNFAEMYVGTLWDYLEPVIEDKKWLPFLCAIFSLILFCNLLGQIPNSVPPTANINFTATMAIIVFLLAQIVGVKKNGFRRYICSFVPSGLPAVIVPLIIPIEIISTLAKPFSLAIRLFANLFAGHAVMLTIISLIFIFKSYWIIPGSIIGEVLLSAFEVFIAFIQAFIFTFLTAFYIGSAINLEN